MVLVCGSVKQVCVYFLIILFDLQKKKKNTENFYFCCLSVRLYVVVFVAYDVALHQIASHFDSVYVSFYKDLASPCAGAMLLGSTDFIDRAAIWQRRFGGNLYTMFPLAAAAAGWFSLTFYDLPRQKLFLLT